MAVWISFLAGISSSPVAGEDLNFRLRLVRNRLQDLFDESTRFLVNAVLPEAQQFLQLLILRILFRFILLSRWRFHRHSIG